MLNTVAIVGRVVYEPELRTTNSGDSVTTIRVAVERNYQKPGEDKVSDFLDVACWRTTAEFVCKYFHKGSWIAVNGSMQTKNREKDGVKFTEAYINAENVSFCGNKESSGNTVSIEFEEQSFKASADEELPF